MYPKSFLIGIYDNTKTLENANKSDFAGYNICQNRK